ncbi:MAG: FAD-dependent monooxygenase [Betaproteobacteria bacterium]
MLHDLAIVGAGPVGATLALGVADAGLRVVVLDARAAGAVPRGDRTLALSHGARLIFERLGVWSPLAAAAGAATPITSIDISQAGGFGVTVLDAAQHQLPALGYVVSYRALQSALDAMLQARSVDVRFDAAVAGVGGTPAFAAVTLAGGEVLTARLAAVADGSGATVAGIARERRAYGQTALVAKVETEPPQGGRAYERFTAHGPMALLPEHDGYGLVWTMTPEQAERALALPDAHFLEELARAFGRHAGRFVRVRARRSFALDLEIARPTVGTRVAVIGNAAQALHPVAGQGFNLGLRDAHELAHAIVDAPRDALGEPRMLASYERARRADRRSGIALTHGLVHLFGTELPFVRWPRGVALALLDALPPAKRAFTRAMLFGVR